MSALPADRTSNCGLDTASARLARPPLPADDTPAAAPARFLNPGYDGLGPVTLSPRPTPPTSPSPPPPSPSVALALSGPCKFGDAPAKPKVSCDSAVPTLFGSSPPSSHPPPSANPATRIPAATTAAVTNPVPHSPSPESGYHLTGKLPAADHH